MLEFRDCSLLPYQTMIKGSIFLPFILTAVLFTASQSQASVNCETIYGGGQTCVSKGEIDIDKKVRDPKSGKFVDNLTINESKYSASDQIEFRLSVTNTGNATFDAVEVKDILPQFVKFVSGPGNFDPNTKTLTYNLSNLKAKETRTDKIVAKIVNASDLPINEGNLCVVNQSVASSEGMSDQDNSQFCIEKVTKVIPPPPIKQTPSTGPEMLPLIGLIPAGLAGILLRRRTNIKNES